MRVCFIPQFAENLSLAINSSEEAQGVKPLRRQTLKATCKQVLTWRYGYTFYKMGKAKKAEGLSHKRGLSEPHTCTCIRA